jgi:hypothetical protein
MEVSAQLQVPVGTWYPFYRALYEPQSRSGENVLALAGDRTPTSQPPRASLNIQQTANCLVTDKRCLTFTGVDISVAFYINEKFM